MMRFRWIEWNLDHIGKHGVDPDEAEMVVRSAKAPFPLRREDEKWMAQGPGRGGRLIQVIFITDPDKTIFVIHARPITDREKHRYRRKRKL